MKKVLVMCNNFSIEGGTGILRVQKFCKYLPNSGWEPIVVKIRNNNIFKFISNKYQIVHDTKVYTSINSNFIVNIGLFMDRYVGNYRCFFLPDAFITCIIPTCLKAIQINKIEHIDIIYTSNPPYSLAIVGAFAKILIKKPLVTDLRDSWTMHPYLKYPFKLSEIFDTMLEWFVFKNSDKIIVTTDATKKEYVTKYGGTIGKKIHVISNGFDYSDIAQHRLKSKKLIITYTGEFYGPRSPERFIAAFAQFIKRKGTKHDIEVHFFGNSSNMLNKLLIEYDLSDYIFLYNRIPNEDVYTQLANSDLLLLIEPSYSFPTKVFEYLASNRPILAIIPEGDLANLINKYSPTSSVISANEDAIITTLDTYHSKWINNVYPDKNVSNAFMNLYNREHLTEDLVHLFNELI